jgi:hypothetical protein
VASIITLHLFPTFLFKTEYGTYQETHQSKYFFPEDEAACSSETQATLSTTTFVATPEQAS